MKALKNPPLKHVEKKTFRLAREVIGWCVRLTKLSTSAGDLHWHHITSASRHTAHHLVLYRARPRLMGDVTTPKAPRQLDISAFARVVYRAPNDSKEAAASNGNVPSTREILTWKMVAETSAACYTRVIQAYGSHCRSQQLTLQHVCMIALS
ncbi:hypothetical protein CcaCcLH18_10667 [Colletotrichum camelliae]|nr:hypothetical protein CcaCcLH18_10667 [Colletotrichum camelliae]